MEALWDHVTDDYDELAFEAGEKLVVVDSSDEFWWYGTYLEQVRTKSWRNARRLRNVDLSYTLSGRACTRST